MASIDSTTSAATSNDSTGDAAGRIVVGVDGSPSSIDALRWAVTQAGLTGAMVHAVIAWHYPNLYGSYPINLDWQSNAAETIATAMRSALGSDSDKVSSSIVEGYAPKVLIDASADADLLVVGNRGHGQVAEILLGSVSQHVVTHALCPVVVIRHAAD